MKKILLAAGCSVFIISCATTSPSFPNQPVANTPATLDTSTHSTLPTLPLIDEPYQPVRKTKFIKQPALKITPKATPKKTPLAQCQLQLAKTKIALKNKSKKLSKSSVARKVAVKKVRKPVRKSKSKR